MLKPRRAKSPAMRVRTPGPVLDEDGEDVLAPGAHAAGGLELLEAEHLVLGPWLAHRAQPSMSRAAAPGEIIG